MHLIVTFIRRTWLPTLLFALPVFVFDVNRGPEPPPHGTMTLWPLIAIPPMWWLAAGARRQVSLLRRAVAGVFCGAMLVLLPATLAICIVVVEGPRHPGGGMAVAALIIAIVGAFCIFTTLGAAIGALTALVGPGDPETRRGGG